MAWTPDGKYVISTQLIPGGGWNVLAVPVEGGDPVSLVKIATGYAVTISPSGRWLAYDTADSGIRNIYVIPFMRPGRTWQISGDGGFAPNWVGSHLYYFNERGVLRTEITEQESTLTIGSEEVLFTAGDIVTFSVSPDEKRILLLQNLEEANRTPLSVLINWQQKLPAQN